MDNLTIKHYGFDFPPHGVIDLLKNISFNQPVVFYILDPFSGAHLPYDEIAALKKTNLFIIISTHEGSSHHHFDILIPKLINDCQVLNKHIILHSNCLYDPQSPISNIGSIAYVSWQLINLYREQMFNHLDYNVTHHFVCLNRQYRWQRYKLVSALLDQQLDVFGKISFLETVANDKRFPLLLDTPNVNQPDFFNFDDMSIKGAFINVITETAYEVNPTTLVIDNLILPGLTEKTYKSVLLGQLPIFVAPYRTVECYRNLGFDPFDDIVDHSYDLEVDPEIRLIKIVNEITRLCSMSMDQMTTLKQRLKPRFIKNIERIKHFRDYDAEVPRWEQLFSELGFI